MITKKINRSINLEGIIHELLYNNQEKITQKNPINSQFIVSYIYGMYNIRVESCSVRRAVNALRSKYVPILSNLRGYWYAQSYDDFEECLNILISRAREIERDIRNLKEARKQFQSNLLSSSYSSNNQFKSTLSLFNA